MSIPIPPIPFLRTQVLLPFCFFKLWLKDYEKEFKPDGWGEASIYLPGKINNKYPNLATVFSENTFFRPYASEGDNIFEKKY